MEAHRVTRPRETLPPLPPGSVAARTRGARPGAWPPCRAVAHAGPRHLPRLALRGPPRHVLPALAPLAPPLRRRRAAALPQAGEPGLGLVNRPSLVRPRPRQGEPPTAQGPLGL